MWPLRRRRSPTPVDPANFTETTFVSSTEIGSITGIAWAPDGSNRLFVTRKGGFSGQQTAQVRIIQNGTILPTPFATESVFTSSECGLLGIAFDPDFVNNGYVYFFLTASSSEQKIVRYTASGNVGTNRTEIVTGLPTNGANHDGGGIGIGNDGRLYWSVGDLGNGTGVDADILSLAAKIGRVNRFTGAALNDNPFFGQGEREHEQDLVARLSQSVHDDLPGRDGAALEQHRRHELGAGLRAEARRARGLE